ncbi:MAG: hypothetical protein JWP04_3565, partial [Belnapia sp.]|nr:hypothetical protein [Belnapia sp.]
MGDLRQQPVAAMMAEQVVHQLEAFEVQAERLRAILPGNWRLADGGIE